jgi:signal peptidase II
MNLNRTIRIVLLLLVLGGTVGCDQTTKHIARAKLGPFDSVMLLGGWGELRLVENPGAFLSLGASLSPIVRTAFFTLGVGIGLLFLSVCLVSRARLNWLVFTGLALALAGGVSNLIDRITRQGLVTDFITLRMGPFQTGVFNVADMAVLFGLGLLLYANWRKRRRSVAEGPDQNVV